MYTKFYDNTIITKFVKELVAKTNVPFVSTWRPGDFAIRGMFYVTKDAIWKCQHTGWPQHTNDVCPKDHPAHSSETTDFRYFKHICPYVFGEKYHNLTGSYDSKVLGYDSTTHYYLGQYLRMMRDIYSLDLMPFYNCYANELIADVDFDSDSNAYFRKNPSEDYKIMSVPVKFGKTYMIALDSDFPVEVMCIVYGSKGIITNLTNNLNSIKDNGQFEPNSNTHPTYRKYLKTQFQHPILYKTIDWHQLYTDYEDNDDNAIIQDGSYDQGLGQFERYLKLLIKVPKNNNSSLVVIEGDYSILGTEEALINTSSNNITWGNKHLSSTTVNSKTVLGDWVRPEIIQNNLSYIDKNIDHIKNDIESNNWEYSQHKNILLSPLGLLQLNDGNIYAFSDRLIEYLLQNNINPLEQFTKNVERIQKYSSSEINYQKNGSKYSKAYTPGVWDKNLQKYLFDLSKDSKLISKKIDLNGYVDKDTESVVSRGQKV